MRVFTSPKPAKPRTEAVGADAVLNEGAAFALDPAENPGKI